LQRKESSHFDYLCHGRILAKIPTVAWLRSKLYFDYSHLAKCSAKVQGGLISWFDFEDIIYLLQGLGFASEI
jgi:hypothetical protein